MRRRGLFVTLFAGAACTAPAMAQTSDLCPALGRVIEVAKRDPHFGPLQATRYDKRPVPATIVLAGLGCTISVEGGRGFYACHRVGDDAGTAEARRLAGEIEACLNLRPERWAEGDIADYTFTVQRSPHIKVYVQGAIGTTILNVITD